jgi:hypothetical protein
MKQIAVAHTSAIEAVEKQAGPIIQAQRAQFADGKLTSPHALPPLSEALLKLQHQRDDLTTTHIKSLQSVLSAASFTKLDSYVRATFKNQQTGVVPVGLRRKPPTPPQARAN